MLDRSEVLTTRGALSRCLQDEEYSWAIVSAYHSFASWFAARIAPRNDGCDVLRRDSKVLWSLEPEVPVFVLHFGAPRYLHAGGSLGNTSQGKIESRRSIPLLMHDHSSHATPHLVGNTTMPWAWHRYSFPRHLDGYLWLVSRRKFSGWSAVAQTSHSAY